MPHGIGVAADVLADELDRGRHAVFFPGPATADLGMPPRA